MKPIFLRTLLLVMVLCVAFTAVQAAEVYLDDGQLIVAGVDDSIGLGAFDVVLSYGPDVSITSAKGLSGFLVVENIQNIDGTTIIVGISTDGLTGDVPVASVATEGTGSITITIRELSNARGDPIGFTNPTTSVDTTVATGMPIAGSDSASSVQTQIPLSPVITVPGETLQMVETELTTAVVAIKTTTQKESSEQSLETSESDKKAESTPQAVLPFLVALSAVFIAIVLNGKE